MADLSFMSQLTDEQRQFAEVIRQRAQQMGIPPDLAVAIAYQESRLNPQPKDSGKGAIGIMQVRPIAALDVGVNPEDLRDLNVNIDAGLRYLKKALTETPDPRLAVIYYNAGPGTLKAFDQGGDLPRETEQYLRSLHSFGAFTPRTEPAAEPSAEPTAEPPSGYELPPRVELQPSEQLQDTKNASERRLAEYVGLGAGVGLSLGRGIKEGAKGGIKGMGQALMQGLTAGAPGAGAAPGLTPAPGVALGGAPAGVPGTLGAPGAAAGLGAPSAAALGGQAALPSPATSAQPTGGMPTAAQAARVSAGTTGDLGTTGRQRMVGFNEQTAQQAARVKAAEQMFGQLTQRGVVPMTASQVLAGMPDMTTTSSGIAVPKQSVAQPMEAQGPQSPLERLQRAQEAQRAARASQTAASVGRRAAPLAPAVAPPAPVQGMLPVVQPKPSGLEQVTQMFSRAAQTGLSAAKPYMAAIQRYVMPPLALAQGAGELVSAKQSMEQGDPLGAALSGLGGVGAIASMATPAALPLAVGAPLAQAFRERMAENRQQFPPDTRPLTPEEEEMASRPVTFYRTGDRRFASRP